MENSNRIANRTSTGEDIGTEITGQYICMKCAIPNNFLDGAYIEMGVTYNVTSYKTKGPSDEEIWNCKLDPIVRNGDWLIRASQVQKMINASYLVKVVN